jgi:hypothetical protein
VRKCGSFGSVGAHFGSISDRINWLDRLDWLNRILIGPGLILARIHKKPAVFGRANRVLGGEYHIWRACIWLRVFL